MGPPPPVVSYESERSAISSLTTSIIFPLIVLTAHSVEYHPSSDSGSVKTYINAASVRRACICAACVDEHSGKRLVQVICFKN